MRFIAVHEIRIGTTKESKNNLEILIAGNIWFQKNEPAIYLVSILNLRLFASNRHLYIVRVISTTLLLSQSISEEIKKRLRVQAPNNTDTQTTSGTINQYQTPLSHLQSQSYQNHITVAICL